MSDHLYLDEDGASEYQKKAFRELLELTKKNMGNSGYVPNMKRIKQALHISMALEKYFEDVDGCTVDTQLMSPSIDCGYINIIGKGIAFSKELMEDVNKCVDEIEIVPNSDGNVAVSLFMYNIMEFKNGNI